MKEAIVHPSITVDIIDSPIPKPTADQVLIKVVVSGSNPKDWKLPEYRKIAHNSGDDIAGIVEAVGENVFEFKPGDRVAAFHEMAKPHGSFAEYAISPAHTTFHIPNKTTFEEAATIPLAAMTAAVGLYLRLGLPEPWHATSVATPIIVYGASGAVGAFTVKLAQASNIHPIIAIAGKGADYVEKLISREKGDTIVDYRKGDSAIVFGIKEALKNAGIDEVIYAYDAISAHNSYQNIAQVLAKNGKITLVNPSLDTSEIPGNIEISKTTVGSSHAEAKDFAYVFFRLFSRGLQEGWFTPHPHQVIPGGLGGVQEGLANLKTGKVSAVKYVFEIADTK